MMPPNKPEGNSKEKMKQMRLPFAPIQKENAISKQKEQQEKERERVALEKEKQKQLEAERAAKEEKLTEPRDNEVEENERKEKEAEREESKKECNIKEEERERITKEKERERKEEERERIKKEKERERKEEERERKEEERERIKKEKEHERKEKEREKKEKEEERERIKKEKERERKEKEEERERIKKEKERERKEKEEERERTKKEKERERKGKEEEQERLEQTQKEKHAKVAMVFENFFIKTSPQPKSTENKNSTLEEKSTCDKPINNNKSPVHDIKNKSGILSQFHVKHNMKLAPVSRSFMNSENKISLDFILNFSKWENSHGLYLSVLKCASYIPSKSSKTWPVQDYCKSQNKTNCTDGDDTAITEEEDEEEKTIASLLALDEDSIIDIDFPEKFRKKEAVSVGKRLEGSVENMNSSVCKTKAKLLQFHKNERPPYWGTWSKKSNAIGPRRPFSRDSHFLDYEYDSDDDWEEEEKGESLSDEEKDVEEDEVEDEDDDDGFFVGHGVLDKEEAHVIDSDEEEYSPEKSKNVTLSKIQLEEDLEIKKMKIRAEQFEEQYKKKKGMPNKLKPRVFGCFWKRSFNTISSNFGHDSKEMIVQQQLMKVLHPYSCVVLSDNNDGPIETSYSSNLRVKQSPSSKLSDNIGTPKVGENSEASNPQSSKKTPGRYIRTFPEEAIPDLIRLVHANSYNKMFLAKEFGVFLQKLDKNRTKNDVKDQNGGRSAKDDCEEDVKEVEVPKTKIISKIQEIAEYKRWTETGNMANRRCWIVRPEVLSDPKWSLNNFNHCEGVNTWKYILEQPKNARPGSTPSANEVFDKDNGVKSNSASPSNTPKRKADESSIDRAYEKPSKYPAPKLLITKFAKILTPEERMQQMTKLREKAEAEREAANSKVQEKIASITKELIDENSSFSIGDLVWGTMKGHPSWPGKIVIPPEDLKRPITKKLLHCVKFFGTHDFGWMAEQEVKPYQQFRDALMGGSKVHSFQRALKEIEAFSLGKNIIDAITEPVPINSGLTKPCVPETTDSQNCTKKIETEEKCNN